MAAFWFLNGGRYAAIMDERMFVAPVEIAWNRQAGRPSSRT